MLPDVRWVGPSPKPRSTTVRFAGVRVFGGMASMDRGGAEDLVHAMGCLGGATFAIWAQEWLSFGKLVYGTRTSPPSAIRKARTRKF